MCILSLQHMKYPRYTFITFRWNTWNMSLKLLKHLSKLRYTPDATRRPTLPTDGHIVWRCRRRPPLPLLLRRVRCGWGHGARRRAARDVAIIPSHPTAPQSPLTASHSHHSLISNPNPTRDHISNVQFKASTMLIQHEATLQIAHV